MLFEGFVHEDPEVIVKGAFSDLSDVLRVRTLSIEELVELEAEQLERMRKEAAEGKCLWYEIWSFHDDGLNIETFFRELEDPVTDWSELEKLTDEQPVGADIQLRLYRDASAVQQIEISKIYDSYFDSSGTFAQGPPILTDINSTENDCIVVRWTKI